MPNLTSEQISFSSRKETDYQVMIHADSPLHREQIKKQILENQEKIDEYERVGIIRCPICKEIEV